MVAHGKAKQVRGQWLPPGVSGKANSTACMHAWMQCAAARKKWLCVCVGALHRHVCSAKGQPPAACAVCARRWPAATRAPLSASSKRRPAAPLQRRNQSSR